MSNTHRIRSNSVPISLFCVALVVAGLMCGCSHTDKKASDAGDQRSEKRPPSKPYQATYSAPDNFAYQTEHFYSDGAGHYRIDISGSGPTLINVLDVNSNETTMWAEDSDRFVRRPSEPTDPLVMRVQLARLPDTSDAQALGERIVHGHKCRGWRKDSTEVWFDNEYGCHVVATWGGITSTLTEFSAKTPDPSVFQPPPGYTQVATRRRTDFGDSSNSRIFSDINRHMH